MKSSVIVFVCGTYSDLSEERGAVLDAIQRLQLQHHSMEFFGARAERPIETCLAEVRRSNLLVIIVGHRYGTLVPGLDVSFSQAEYEEACRLQIPCLVYIRDEYQVPQILQEQDSHKAQLLQNWKSILKERHTPAIFRDSSKLAVQVAVDIGRTVNEMEKAAGQERATSQTVSFIENTSLVRADSRFRVRYCESFGDKDRQLLNGLATDSSGNIVIVGDFWGSIDFGLSTLTSGQDRSIFVTKLDAKGRPIWSKAYGSQSEQVAVGIGVDGAGAVLVASAFAGNLSFGGDTLISEGRYNVAVAKLDPNGNHVWSKSFGDNKYQVPECIGVSNSGTVCIAGRFQGAIDFGGIELRSQSNQTDIFVANFSPDGQVLWAKRFGGPYEQQTRSMGIDKSGNIALTGVFKGAIIFDGHSLTEAASTEYCGFLVKLDANGNAVWCKRFGEPSAEQGSALSFDPGTGDLIVGGIIRNKLPAELQPLAICLFARYDTAGVLRWSKTFGSHAFADSIAVAEDGRILLTGHFEKDVDFGLGTLTSAGGYDVFAAVFSADGYPLWSQRFGDPRQQFIIKGAHGLNRSIILAGSFHGTIDFGTGPLAASGYNGSGEGTEDVFLAILEDKDQ